MVARHALARSSLVGAMLTLGCNGFVGDWGVLDGFGRKFQGVEIRQTRDQVVAAIGQPAREESVFHLPRSAGHEELFQKARESQASSFLYWDTGIDEVAVVGLDESGHVVFKCRAGA
jgi:hypothetical protein